jgi:hypothetical protein
MVHFSEKKVKYFRKKEESKIDKAAKTLDEQYHHHSAQCNPEGLYFP